MHTQQHTGFLQQTSQQGFVLIVALILLLVLTLLGLAAASSTSLEQRMASNARNRDLAFQSAEAGLRAALNCQRIGLAPCSLGASGYYVFNSAAPVNQWTVVTNWSDPTQVILYSGVPGTTPLPSVEAQPGIIIEQLPPVAVPGGNLGQQQFSGGTPTIQLWRITALGTGGDSSSTAMLQIVN